MNNFLHGNKIKAKMGLHFSKFRVVIFLKVFFNSGAPVAKRSPIPI